MTHKSKSLITVNIILICSAWTLVQLPSRALAGEPRAALDSPGALAAEGAPDRESDLYAEGTSDLDQNQWEKALDAFKQVIELHGPHANAAIYWRAYALNKLERREEALQALAGLEKSNAQDKWTADAKALDVEIRQAMGQKVSPESVTDEDLKLIAIQGLMNSDPEHAVPLLEKVLQGNQTPRVKERALFVLSQSGSSQARSIISEVAHGQMGSALQSKAIQDLAISGDPASKAEPADIYAHSDDVAIKKSILRAFMISGEKDRILTAAKSEKNVDLRREAVRQLGVMGAGDNLWELYQSESNPEVKREIVRAFFVGGQGERLYSLAQNEKDVELRREAIRSLGLMGSQTADHLVSLYQAEKTPEIRKEILNAFFLQGNCAQLVGVGRSEKDPELRKTAIEKLSMMKCKEGTDFMMEILNK
jgi:tetratricopeptide (TPR) repeat protein